MRDLISLSQLHIHIMSFFSDLVSLLPTPVLPTEEKDGFRYICLVRTTPFGALNSWVVQFKVLQNSEELALKKGKLNDDCSALVYTDGDIEHALPLARIDQLMQHAKCTVAFTQYLEERRLGKDVPFTGDTHAPEIQEPKTKTKKVKAQPAAA